MYLQIIQGRVGDPKAARAAMDRWQQDLAPGAAGWLGGTYGITDDGVLIAVVRFDSATAALRNSERPEHAAWWSEMAGHFNGEITVHDCDDVTLLLAGGSDQAGFVQIIQGRVRDRERARSLARQASQLVPRFRPDILGATIAIDGDGFLTETVAFTSEAAVRAAQKLTMPADVSRLAEQELALLDDVTYLDLHQPWFASHG
jgi:hypothetical protein